jgi:Xaa-Pro aminopeptidase
MPDFERRRQRLCRRVTRTGAQALLVTDFTNVTYLTGFTGDDSYLLVMPHGTRMLSDSRYTQQLEEECPGLPVEVRSSGTHIHEFSVQILKKNRLARVAVEANSMTVGLAAKLTEEVPGLQLLPAADLVERLREIKDQEEIARICEAIDIAQRAFAVIRASLRAERTEREIANELEYQIRLFGGAGCSFTPIVGVGSRGALPHATLSDHRVGESGFVLIDWGARKRGYVSDLTRVLITGKISPKLEAIYGVVLRAQQAGIDAIRPGAIMEDVDAAARRVIEEAGFGKRFGHALGHGIGLAVHEAPRLGARQKRPLKPGMVVTVEPGIYLPNWGGVRIEDDILVTRGGHEVLSNVPRELADCVLN